MNEAETTTLERFENEADGLAVEVFTIPAGLGIRLVDVDSGRVLPIVNHFSSDRFSVAEVTAKAAALAAGRPGWRSHQPAD